MLYDMGTGGEALHNPRPGMTTTTTCECPKCNGTGKLHHFSHVANGDCFACFGTGRLNLKSDPKNGTPMASLVVFMRSGEFDYADFRCTLLKGNTWGQCLFAKCVDSAEEARNIWRQLKGLPNASLQTSNIISTDCREDQNSTYQEWQAA